MAKRQPSSLSTMSVAALEREIAKRRSKVGGLEKKARRLRKQLAKVEAKIAALGGSVGGGRGAPGRTRPRNEQTLTEALRALLKGKEMNVTAAADAVQKAGYRTSAANFRTMVNITLTKGPFKRVSRGVYTAK